MSVFSFSLNKQEEKVIKDYAKLNNITVSELFRTAVLEKIEADIDLTLYKEAMDEHKNSPSDISFDDMMKELDEN